MSIISGGGAVVGAGGAAAYEIERSLRFNSPDNTYLQRTPASSGSATTGTTSFWIKRAAPFGTDDRFVYAAAPTGHTSNPDIEYIDFSSNDEIIYFLYTSSAVRWNLKTTAVYRDPSAWYHIVAVKDTNNATSSDRIRIYVNGVRVTAFATATYPSSGQAGNIGTAVQHRIGEEPHLNRYNIDGYLADFYYIDGQALDPTSFGEYNTDTGVWQPIEYTGSYGTNGFYLNFSNNSSTTTLGNDSSGNGNNWTTNNFSVTAGAGNDSLVDTPTPYGTDTGAGGEVRGNYCTLNSVKPVTNSITFSNGNLQYKPGSSWSTTTYVEGTIGVVGGSTGKYYWEMSADQTGAFWTAGLALQNNTIGGSNIGTTGSVMIYDNAKYVNGTSTSSYLTSLSANEVLGVALDAATGKVWFRDSGGWLGSGDPAAGTNETGIPTGFSGATLVPVTQANSVSTVTANFGQRPFAYTAPSGFKALVTTNLPEPTIEDGEDYFNTVLYTGNNTTNSITNVGFQPDLVWIKRRDATQTFSNAVIDAVRGRAASLVTNLTNAEATSASDKDLTAFTSTGFTLGASNQVSVNDNTGTYVAWNWKANGAGSTNTAGTITSTVSVNTTSGFSIVTYSGNSVAGATVGHGLGITPSMIIVKSRTASAGYLNWGVYHVSLGATKVIYLNTTGAESVGIGPWNDTAPTSTVFSLGNDGGFGFGISGQNYVAYCFAPVAGYSAFGSYTGNGLDNGPYIFTNFRPAFVMIKRATSGISSGWLMYDDKRSTYNVVGNVLEANESAAEGVDVSTRYIDFLSNGFKLRTFASALNHSDGGTYIYMAFAENPFKYALAR